MIPAVTLTGSVELGERAVGELAKRLSGRLLLPGDDGYDDARTIWNRMIDRRPALIARCAGTDDVVTAIRFAREHDLLISVKGGGHNVTGHAVCEGGVMIDLSPIKEARVDAAQRVITAGPGLTWGELDTATQRHGLATTGGIISSTGVPASPWEAATAGSCESMAYPATIWRPSTSSPPTAPDSMPVPTTIPSSSGACAEAAATSGS